MFEIRILIEDNKLAKALHALDGLGNNLQVIPVRNAVIENGEVVESGEATTAIGFVREIITKYAENGRTEIDTNTAVKLGEQSPSRFNAGAIRIAMQKCKAQGLLTRTSRGYYQINH